MEVELLEIRDFLASHHPFDQLPVDALKGVLADIQIRYMRRDSSIKNNTALLGYLYLIRTGAMELRNQDGELLARLAEGDMFGYRACQREGQEDIYGVMIEDSLVYQFPRATVDALCKEHPQLDYFLNPVGRERLRDAITYGEDYTKSQLSMMTTRVRDLIKRRPVTMPPTATIRETAMLMSKERVSSVLITENDELRGIVTDRDMRNRVVAKGLDSDLPITEIMSRETSTIGLDEYTFEAQLKMARQNIHHLPVMDGDKVAGMFTATDLAKHHTTSAVYLVSDIYKQHDIGAIRDISSRVPDLLVNLVAADVTAESAGHVIASVVDAITGRLLKLAENKLGPPPVAYAWLAAGSQARNELTAKSDQDNCMLLDDEYDPKQHGDYFKRLAEFVCSGLNECCHFYRQGEMVSDVEQWRQPVSVWKDYYTKWIDCLDPKTIQLTSVFFDLRCIYGEQTLFLDLSRHMLDRSCGSREFLTYMAGNALANKPPLGFFRNFVLIQGGEHDSTFDLKHTGAVPIVDMVRVHALASGISVANTQDRIKAIADAGVISRDVARDLRDTFEFLSSLRIRHQARQIKDGRAANNFISPERLSNFERNHLKDAFSVIRTMQAAFIQRYKN